MKDARIKIEPWRVDYNEFRPHSSLGDMTPTDFARTIDKKEEERAAGKSRKSDILPGPVFGEPSRK